MKLSSFTLKINLILLAALHQWQTDQEGIGGRGGGGGSEGSKAYRVVHFKFIFMQFLKIHVYMYILIVGRPVI